MIRKLRYVWDHLELIVMTFFLLVIMGMVSANIVLRFVFNMPLSFSEELCRYCYLWLVFFAFSYATRQNAHIRVDVLKNKLPMSSQEALNIFNDVLALVVFIWLLKRDIEYTHFVAIKRSFALQIPMQIVASILPISSVLMIVRLLEKYIRRFWKWRTRKEADGK